MDIKDTVKKLLLLGEWFAIRLRVGNFEDAYRDLEKIVDFWRIAHNDEGFARDRMRHDFYGKISRDLITATGGSKDLSKIYDLYLKSFDITPEFARVFWRQDVDKLEILQSLARTKITLSDTGHLQAMFGEHASPEVLYLLIEVTLRNKEALGGISNIFARFVAPYLTEARLGRMSSEIDDLLAENFCQSANAFRWTELLAAHDAGLVKSTKLAAANNVNLGAHGGQLIAVRQRLGRVFSQEDLTRLWSSYSHETIESVGSYCLRYSEEFNIPDLGHRDGKDEVNPYLEGILRVLKTRETDPSSFDSKICAWMIDQYCRYSSAEGIRKLGFVEKNALMKSPHYREKTLSCDLGL